MGPTLSLDLRFVGHQIRLELVDVHRNRFADPPSLSRVCTALPTLSAHPARPAHPAGPALFGPFFAFTS